MPQGEIHIRSTTRSGAMSCLVVPAEDKQAWYFVPFPNREVMEDYAKEYGLTIVEPQEEEDADNG